MADSKSAASGPASKRALGDRPRQVDLGSDGPTLLYLPGGKTKESDPIAAALFAAGVGVQAKPHITAPYEENPHVHACVKVKGAAVRQVPLELWIGDPRRDEGARLLPDDDPLWRLIERPTPNMTASEFLEAGLHHRAHDGEDFWFLLDERMRPVDAGAGSKIPIPRYIVPVRGRWVSGVFDPQTGWPRTWNAQGPSGVAIASPAASVVHFRDYNVDDPLRGLGDTEALAIDLDIEWQAVRYQRALLKNGGDPGGFIITENQLAPDEQRAAEEEAREAFDVRNAGQWKVLSGKGVKYEANKITPKDMEFQALKPWTREVACEVYGVPPPLIGVLKDAALANIETSVRLFWEGGNGILAYLRTVEDVMTMMFLRELAHPQAKKLYARFNLSGVKALQKNLTEQLTAAAIAVRDLRASPNEAFKIVQLELDKKTLEYGDEHVVPQGLTTMDRVLEDAAAPPETPDASDGDGDGKEASTTAREQDPALDPVLDPVSEAAKARRAYWAKKEASVLLSGERAIRSGYRAFRKQYETEQLKRIRDFANDGDEGLRALDPEMKADTGGGGGDDGAPKVSNSDIQKLLLPRDRVRERMEARVRPAVIKVWATALEDVADELAVEFPLLPTSPEVIAAMDLQVTKLVDGHVDFLAERVRAAIIEALAQATSTGSLQEQVAEVLDELQTGLRGKFSDRQSRANTIARTETAGAANNARYMEMRHVGVRRHTWVTSKDAAVRGTPGGPYEDAEFSHYELDGKTVDLGNLFDASGHPGLTRPHDPDSQPGDSINCRCLAMPERIEDEEN